MTAFLARFDEIEDFLGMAVSLDAAPLAHDLAIDDGEGAAFDAADLLTVHVFHIVYNSTQIISNDLLPSNMRQVPSNDFFWGWN